MSRTHLTLLPAILAAALAALAPTLASAAGKGSRIEVSVDQARVLKIDRQAETVIIGNPSIVDVTVHDSETLVLTGRSYGITNLVILDREGASIIDEQVFVKSFEDSTVRIYRQAERTTYSCSPECEPTVTIGDNQLSFGAAAGQFETRQAMAAGAAK